MRLQNISKRGENKIFLIKGLILRILIVIFISISALITLSVPLLSESFSVIVTPQKGNIYLGEKAPFEIKITTNSAKVEGTNIEEVLKDFNIQNIEKKSDDNGTIYNFYLQFFKIGKVVIPEIEFTLKNDNDSYKVSSNQTELTILSNLTDNQSFKDIKPPLLTPFYLTKNEKILLTISILVAVILAIVMIKFFRKRGKVKETLSKSALDYFMEISLVSADLIEKGKLREFYFNISEASRGFIDRKFLLNTLESTIKEITNIFAKDFLIDKDIKSELLLLFKKWEYYKFTNDFPSKVEALSQLERVKSLVEKIEQGSGKSV